MSIMDLPEGEEYKKAGWPELKPAEVVIFLYLLHHPSNPSRLARHFANHKWDGINTKGVCDQEHVGKFMKNMAEKKILYVPKEPKKKVGRKPRLYFGRYPSKTYFVNPYLIERFGGHISWSSTEDVPTKTLDPNLNFATIVREISQTEEHPIIQGLAKYKKFDLLTIILHLQSLAEDSLELLNKKALMGYKDEDAEIKFSAKELGHQFIEFEKLCAYLKNFPDRMEFDPIEFFGYVAENYSNLQNIVIRDERVKKPIRNK
jgi:hypothetical protein